MRATAFVAMLLIGASGCGRPGPGTAGPAPCEETLITVDNYTRHEVDVYVYSGTTRREELVGTADAGARATFALPPGSTGSPRIVRRNINQQQAQDDRPVNVRTHCA